MPEHLNLRAEPLQCCSECVLVLFRFAQRVVFMQFACCFREGAFLKYVLYNGGCFDLAWVVLELVDECIGELSFSEHSFTEDGGEDDS